MGLSTLRTGVCLLSITASCAGQPSPKLLDPNGHAWVSYSGEHEVAGPWGLHIDGQWRRSDVGLKWQQYQIRPGLNYKVSDNLLLTLGYAYTRSYPYGDFPASDAVPEHRIYQQVLRRHRLAGVRMQHRVRMEQRFIEYATAQPRSWTYQNRFRYLAKMEVPLGRQSTSGAGWYLPVYDEILIGIPPNYGARPFDQNRLFLGIGRSFGKTNFEAGYLNQFLSQRNGRVFEMNSTLFITVTSSVPLSGLWR
jgi:hypothetical protein